MAVSYRPAKVVVSSVLSTVDCRVQDLCRQADLRQLWGLMFLGCRCCEHRTKSADTAGLRQTDIGYVAIDICLGVEIAAHCDYSVKLRLSKFSYLLTVLTYILRDISSPCLFKDRTFRWCLFVFILGLFSELDLCYCTTLFVFRAVFSTLGLTVLSYCIFICILNCLLLDK